MTRPFVSVVVSTYEWPAALDVVLGSLAEQGDDAFEVIVADDGSGEETRALVERWRASGRLTVDHVWQPNEGWRKSRILNLGALEARGDYLVFLDGDSVPRREFLRAVRRCILPSWFVASKRLHLSQRLTGRVINEHLPVWRWSAARWLFGAPREVFTTEREIARLGLLVPIRDRRRPWRPRQPEFFAPYWAYGFCFGVSRTDFERVNGFDLRFEGWGGEDEDIAARLRRAGLKCGWPGPKATMLHLWHEPKQGTTASNDPLVRQTLASDHVLAKPGLRDLEREIRVQVSANRVAASSSSSEPV